MSTILLVEDNPKLLASHKRLFASHGAYVLEATTPEQGIAVFKRNAGLIAGVVTDLRLQDESDENDVSGTQVARAAKSHDPQIPTVCVSAFDYTDKIPDSPFDLYYRKGVKEPELNLLGNVAAILDRFELYAQSRFSKAPKKLLELRDRYKIAEDDFLQLIAALPMSTRVQMALLRVHSYVEQEVGTGQKRVLFIEADSETGKQFGIAKTLPIVAYKSAENEVTAELYGIPAVYAYGDTEISAIVGLLASLKFYWQDLQAGAGATPDQQILRFKDFLGDIFNAT